MSWQIIVKILKIKDKEKIFKWRGNKSAARRNDVIFRGTTIQMMADSLSAMMEARRKGDEIFKALKFRRSRRRRRNFQINES